MKKILAIIVLMIPAVVFATPYDDMVKDIMKKLPAAEKKSPIAVIPFSETGTNEQSTGAMLATEETAKALVNAGATVTERSQVDKIIQEQELQQTGVLSNENASEIGKGVGAKYSVLGTVTKIDKYGEEGNEGLKVNIKLVDVTTFKILAVSSGEVAAGDASASYKRKTPRKPAEYPGMLEIYGGVTKLKYRGSYKDPVTKEEIKTKSDMDNGMTFGARYTKGRTGFFTSAWEINHARQKFENTGYLTAITQVNWIPILRIPLWVYMPSLPDYTSIYTGISVGLGISKFDYFDGTSKQQATGFGFDFSYIVGFRLGLIESVSLFAEYRNIPTYANLMYHPEEPVSSSKTIAFKDKFNGGSLYFGLSFAP